MLYCKPYTDLSEIRMLFPSESLDANGIYGAYTALEGDLPLGKSLVRVEGNSCRILRVETQSFDALLCELLVRASLHFAANRGAFLARCALPAYQDTLLTLGFSERDGDFSGEIPTLLQGSCAHCHPQNG